MPRINIKPLIKLSKEQYKVFWERVFQKEGRLTTKAAGTVMQHFEPPVESKIGALIKRRPLGGGEVEEAIEKLPIAEARAKYFASPEEYLPGKGAPSAKVMSMPLGMEEAGALPEELAQKLAYERVRQVPIIPPVSRTARVMQQELGGQETEAALRRVGVRPEDIRPGVRPETVLEEVTGRKPSELTTIPAAAELSANAEIADELWRNLCGKLGSERSLGAKVWEMLRSSSRQVSHIKTGRDYFISSFVRFRQDPVKFTKAYPREAKILRQLWSEWEASLGPQPVAIPGTNIPGKAGGGVLVGGVE